MEQHSTVGEVFTVGLQLRQERIFQYYQMHVSYNVQLVMEM